MKHAFYAFLTITALISLSSIASDHTKMDNVCSLLHQRQRGVRGANRRLAEIMPGIVRNRVLSEYGWRHEDDISAGDCPSFKVDRHGRNYIAYPPSRRVEVLDSQCEPITIKQDFHAPSITSLDGIGENVPKEKRMMIIALELSRTSINEISDCAATDLREFPNLKIIVLPNEASAEQKKQNQKNCPKITFSYIDNSEKQRLIQQAERLR